MTDNLRTPMLIWVDDHANRGEAFKAIAHAKSLGIQVHTFKSTLETEMWINHNIDFLRKHNTGAPKGIRFITDVVRYEETEDGMKLEIDAGFKIVKFIRHRLSNIPILVRTHSNNLTNTKFVREFWLTGSTCEDRVVNLYIDELAGVSKDNNGLGWAHYNARV